MKESVHRRLETSCACRRTTAHDHGKPWPEDIGGEVSRTGERSDAPCVAATFMALGAGWVTQHCLRHQYHLRCIRPKNEKARRELITSSPSLSSVAYSDL